MARTIFRKKGNEEGNKKSNKEGGAQKRLKSTGFKAVAALFIVSISLVSVIGVLQVRAETYPGGDDNGLTSRIKSIYNTLVGLGYGSDTNSPDWGAMWNRINTAATWTPGGDADPADVRKDKTFYSNSRDQQTGTYPAPGPCPTQVWQDNTGGSTPTSNCTADIAWTVPSPPVTGDDKRDERTGIIWSKALANDAGTVVFTTGTGSTWSWSAVGANNVAVGNKTAIQLCAEMNGGGVWRLPVQKELQQAYIDGSFFNLDGPAATFWSATEGSATVAWRVNLSTGGATSETKTSLTSVRCVR